jgi:hypothetical protein
LRLNANVKVGRHGARVVTRNRETMTVEVQLNASTVTKARAKSSGLVREDWKFSMLVMMELVRGAVDQIVQVVELVNAPCPHCEPSDGDAGR